MITLKLCFEKVKLENKIRRCERIPSRHWPRYVGPRLLPQTPQTSRAPMPLNPHPYQQHAGVQHEVFQLQHQVTRPKVGFFKKKWANPGLFLFIFVFLTWYKSIQIDKSIDGVLGTWTWGGRMEGADESTEPWRKGLILLYNWYFHTRTWKRKNVESSNLHKLIIQFKDWHNKAISIRLPRASGNCVDSSGCKAKMVQIHHIVQLNFDLITLSYSPNVFIV